MKEKYNTLYKIEEKFRLQLIADLQKYSDEILHTKPRPDKWRVADIIAHLISRDEYEFNYISKKLNDGSKAEKTGLKARIRRGILKVAFALPIKFKVPKQVAPSTEYLTLKELETKWDSISKAKHQLLNNLNESEFYKDILKHPRVGKINFVQVIDFGIDHFKRHEEQIKRTLQEVQNKQ